MEFKVITPKGVIYNKKIDRITFPGALGEFTVLHNHAPILTTLQKGIIHVVINGEKETLEVEKGIIEVKQNKIRAILE